MATIFYCFANTSKFITPHQDDLQKYGGTLFTDRMGYHVFKLNNGDTARSPSGACKACLKRNGLTNEWQGPNHVYIKQAGGEWTLWKNRAVALENKHVVYLKTSTGSESLHLGLL